MGPEILLYAKLASDAALLVRQLTEIQGMDKPSQAMIDKVERQKAKVNDQWASLAPSSTKAPTGN